MAYIEMTGISKRFGSVQALDSVDLSIEKGEIHALLGENGAGKTTIMKVLYGMHMPDSGEIRIGGRKADIRSTIDSIALNIGMVHQHFMLIPVLTVAENVIIGNEPRKGLFLDRKEALRRVGELSEKSGLMLDPSKKVSELSVGECQRLEILKIIYKGADILIFDEPTAVLTPLEVNDFFQILRRFKAEGKTIIIITHKLYEVMDIADRCTILRDGRKITTIDKEGSSEEELARLMVGRDMDLSRVRRSSCLDMDDSVVSIRNLNYTHGGVKVLDDFSLTIHRGEIVGLAGIDGNGQSELSEILAGTLRADTIEYTVAGKPVKGKVRDMMADGIGVVPEDRNKTGLVSQLDIAQNVILGYEDDAAFSGHGLMKWKEIYAHGEKIRESYRVKAVSSRDSVGSLSGGNQQKLLIGRVFSRDVEFIVCCQPTRGVDIAASEYIHDVILDFRDRGKAVLLISADLDEVRKLSDTIAVIYKGHINSIDRSDSYDDMRLGKLMTGGEE